MGNILILKKRGQRYRYEIRPLTSKKFVPSNCNMEVNLNDYKNLALFLSDLKALWGVPIDKAIEEYKKNKEQSQNNPFW